LHIEISNIVLLYKSFPLSMSWATYFWENILLIVHTVQST
jgi:hypothetical protein